MVLLHVAEVGREFGVMHPVRRTRLNLGSLETVTLDVRIVHTVVKDILNELLALRRER